MKNDKTFFKYIDFLRVFFCLAILLYHFGILKGGYLAVCSFFALSGFLSWISAAKKEKFSLLEYYKKRFVKLYLPLLVVVFISTFACYLLKDFIWLNLKPEVTSVLLGYNNFWQINANLDYFARHINSPFMHLWYMGILLQFDLVFPFIFVVFKKLKEKVNRYVPLVLSIILTIAGTIYFYIASIKCSMMFTYYGTLTRIFSLLMGVTLGIIYTYFKPKVSKKWGKKAFYFYFTILGLLFYFIAADSKFYAISMIISSLITLRLIDYAATQSDEDLPINDKLLRSLASVSYEIYLVQYPVLFMFQYVDLSMYVKVPLIVFAILFISYYLHYALRKEKNHFKFKKLLSWFIFYCLTVAGIGIFIFSENYSQEMKELEDLLSQNEKMIEEKKQEYEQKMQEENQKLQELLTQLETDESKLGEVVKALPVVGVGDSVMLGAVDNLYDEFPSGYFDGKVSRSVWAINDLLKELKAKGMLNGPVVINGGANGDCSEACKKEIMETCADHPVFWLTVTNDADVHVNDKLFAMEKEYDNLHIIDWNTISGGNPEYFAADMIHLTIPGRKLYTESIYNAIYEVYAEEYKNKKEELIKDYQEKLANNINFYGNDVLLNAFEKVAAAYPNGIFNIDYYSVDGLKYKIQTDIAGSAISNKIVLAFDNSLNISKDAYAEIIKTLEGKKIFILNMTDENLKDLVTDNVKIIDFYSEIKKHEDYLMQDNIHLSDKGNEALLDILKKEVN